MASNPEVSGALVIGSQRLQAALLIEPASGRPLTTAEQTALVERIWPSVDETNRNAPAHARVEKSFVLIVPADRRLIREGKGTFMRDPSISQYKEEIESLYANADVVLEDLDDGTGEAVLYATGLGGTIRLIRHIVRDVTGWSKVDDSENFFDRGMDSLQGLQLTCALRRSFYHHDFALSTVYRNPTTPPPQLAQAILTRDDDGRDEDLAMRTLLGTHRGLIEKIPVSKCSGESPHRVSGTVNVLLTGSTGTLGTHLLRALLPCDGVRHIFCLNRGEDGGEAIQHQAFATSGLATTGFDDGDGDNRVTIIKASLQQPSLGLDGTTYESLREHVGLIIHTAWPVNFNLNFPLPAFRSQLAGLVNLLTQAAATTTTTTSRSSPGAKFVFVSSVAVVEGYTAGPPPEEVLASLDTPARFDSVDFVPIDLLADVLVELAVTTTTTRAGREAGAAAVFNLRNPRPAPWRSLLPAITDAVAARQRAAGRSPLQAVSPANWLAALRASSIQDDDNVAVRNPAVVLLDFFGGLWGSGGDEGKGAGRAPAPTPDLLQSMAVERALEARPTVRGLAPVGLEWMRKWVGEWMDIGEK